MSEFPTCWSTILFQAPNESVATASTAAAKSSLTSWSSCPASTTSAARISATATSAAPPRATPPRPAPAATRIQTRRQQHRQPRLSLVPDSWLEAQVGLKSLSSSSYSPRSSLSESKVIWGANNGPVEAFISNLADSENLKWSFIKGSFYRGDLC